MTSICQSGAGLARPEPQFRGDPASSRLVQDVGALIRTGDQAAYERYAQGHYAPAALRESSAAYQASLLARIFTDTAGFQDLRLVGAAAGWVQAEGRARITRLPYCLTVSRARIGDRDFITEVSARSLHPAAPDLATPAPGEVIGTLDRLARAYGRRNLFSGVILIARGDRVLFRRAYGYASPRLAMRMRLDTRLNTASIAKMFTGVAIAQLVESGRLSFDDTVGRHWPDFPNPAIRDRVTIRQLLTHTSGLGPKDYYDDPRYPAAAENLRSLADYLRLAVDTPLEGTPGTYAYSNSGYLILGAIIERVSGQDFYAYIRERIFRPAGMTDSLYAPADVQRLRTAASLTNFRELPDHSYLYELGRPIE
ncbi:MAG TPA: serine hydrolase domain-containing protein, partial [Allosphingosinicella sp.]|nr:serine hydrolase domain-containing protein [Allosphingosinicella sp.]